MQKAFNAVSKVQCYPDGAIGWRRKTTTDMTWANYKQHFTQEDKEHKKANADTTKSSGYQIDNATNQALLEAQNDVKSVTESCINGF